MYLIGVECSAHKELNSSIVIIKGAFAPFIFLERKMRYYLETLIKAKGLIETFGAVFISNEEHNEENEEIYKQAFDAHNQLEKAISKLQKK